jgi:hypothetical protein
LLPNPAPNQAQENVMSQATINKFSLLGPVAGRTTSTVLHHYLSKSKLAFYTSVQGVWCSAVATLQYFICDFVEAYFHFSLDRPP